MSRTELAYRKYNVFSAVNVPGLDGVQSSMNLRSCRYDILHRLMRRRAVATLSFQINLYLSNFGKEWSFAYSDVSLVKIWHVVEAVDFIDIFQTAFLNHHWSTSWTFFCRLEQKTHEFVLGYLGSLCVQNLGSADKCCHVAIMPTHMCVVGGCLVCQMWVVLWYRQAIHVSSQRHRGQTSC